VARVPPANKRTAAPVSEETMLSYLAHLSRLPMHTGGPRERGVRYRPAPSTSWIWYSAVRFVHSIGRPPLPWECGKQLALAMTGYENEMREAGWVPKKAPRAYPDDVRRMVRAVNRETGAGRRDAAILLNGWRTAGRAADLASYRIRAVTRTPSGLDLLLTDSKNLKPGQSHTFAVRDYLDLPDYNPEFDAPLAMFEHLEYLSTLGERKPHLPLFRPYDKWDNLSPNTGTPAYRMSTSAIVNIVRKYALLAGIEAELTMHSLRRGYATWLRELGYDSVSIARALNWAPGGSINEYLEEADRWSGEAPGARAFL
jgi:integrase